MTRGDLHIHSTASDGSLGPRQIVAEAKILDIDTIAIADHNTINGIEEAFEAGSQYGVNVIPAVEISAKYREQSIHVLGYFRDLSFYNDTFQRILKFVKAHKLKEARGILSGFMQTDGSGDHLSVTEGIELLRIFNAVPVLAHPVRISMKYLPYILSQPFEGIEAKYCNNSDYDTLYFIDIALSKFKFYTGGSDFHSKGSGYKTHCSIGNPHLNEAELKRFLKVAKPYLHIGP
ncbi:hypothetical protein OXPF_41890 [Oxobacter pfennigii]|uniref:Polymerase/histidinol phosphatase N-terminal domain-containing protein n=1 Tax=Oxobacter pfennigii TaxID=36849 RepID=A0A0P8W4J1_9CLOT|nr:PHP domain-containing protein [Oxobacter pfennigii]KPU42404.1 hypothetical protein OXPF_41890 [Oxobacter pfennigii]